MSSNVLTYIIELQSHFNRLQIEFKDFFDKYAPKIVGKTAVSFFKQRFQIEGWERAGDWQQVQRIPSYTLHICLCSVVPMGLFGFRPRAMSVDC